MSVSTVARALANCALTTRWEQGMCGQFCAAMYGYDASGYKDAITQWQQIPAALKFPGSADAPPGALLFWSGGSQGHGHVAISVGDGTCFSIDIAGAGTVSRAPVRLISQLWGLPYQGWSVPYFQGGQWMPTGIYGTDVSMYQPINFALTLPGDGKPVDFAFIKVTEGSGWTSTRWTGQRQWAKDKDLVRGFYHFARPGSMTAQVDRFLGLVQPEPGDILAFDWEDAGVTSAQKDAALRYMQAQAPGNKSLLYCNTDFWRNRDTSSFTGDGLWIATGGIPAGSPPIQAPWLIHQYSTAGSYDHDLAQFDSRDAMRAWAGGDDMALSADDKTWLANTIKAQVTAVVKAEVYGAAFNADKVRSPDDAPSNPTWAAASYLRESYLRLTEIKAQGAANGSALSAVSSSLASIGSALAALKTELDALDLSALPAEIAAKIEALKLVVTVTEGTPTP